MAFDAHYFVGHTTAWRVAVRWGWLVAIFDVISIVFLLGFAGILPMTYASEAPRANLEAAQVAEGALDHYYRDHLTEKEQQLYDIVENAYRTMVHVVDLPDGTTLEELDQATFAVLADNPDIFWVDPHYNYQQELWGLSTFTVHYLIEDPDEVAQLAAVYDNRARGVIKQIQQKDEDGIVTDYEMAQGFYNWIVRYAEYEPLDSRDQHIAAMFDERKGVCAGYSKLMKYLCDRAGIPCLYVAGGAWAEIEASSSGNHAWNVMELDGNTVYVDVTWGDDGTNADWTWFGKDWATFRLDHRSRDGEYFDRPEWADGTRVEDVPFEETETSGDIADLRPRWAEIAIASLAENYEEAEASLDDILLAGTPREHAILGGQTADAAGFFAAKKAESL